MQTIETIDQEISELNERLKMVKGTETEVYTRIVGYHRAVDNWNKGKKEEYNERREFRLNLNRIEEKNLSFSNGSKREKEEKVAENNVDSSKIAFYKIFTSQYCRNCPPVKNFVSKLSIVGEDIDVSTDLGINVSRKYDIMSTPTVIFFDENDNAICRAYSVEELKKIFTEKEALVG